MLLLSIIAIFRNAIILFVVYQLIRYLLIFWTNFKKKNLEPPIHKKKIIREKNSKYVDFEEIKNN